MKQQTLLYLALSGKSYWRLFHEFPIMLRLLFLLMFCGLLYFFLKVELTRSFTNYVVIYFAFVWIARWVCRISTSERVLLSLLRIPVFRIKVVKCVLLSLPFFLLDIGVATMLLTLGVITVVLLPERMKRSKVFPAFYAPASYQWIGMYRRSGLWVLSFGLLLLGIALWQQNTNMICFALGWIIVILCFIANYNIDPPEFLVIYKNSRFLISKKLIELIFNVALPSVFLFTLVLAVDYTNVLLYLKFISFFMYIDLLLFYCRYICYPHVMTALALFAFLVLLSAISLVSFPAQAVAGCCLLLPFLHHLAVNNLKSLFYHERN